ncbi:BZ3500_MvSof-1268-A1-R1_Chr7-3g09650 [Microbotryum saponariae]|uniref:BZ3500_MvSof-1268-A1-R1_Chr7-3g09650 protein n=1 Tax=Microbotryum saponariae TaxID=289078 RepID=A0A2X0L0W9_9BASI|nr:BZ3501_MvSof-1269-A2-R1_Chr7-2g09373 [Microbotryum saponariae]SDA02347.1 BZ3500_MvSof-1268-A1-R1_Chr7-3g09650 [Microbotryum saponariae]
MRAAWRRRFGSPKPCLNSANWYYNLGANAGQWNCGRRRCLAMRARLCAASGLISLCLSSTSDHARISLPAPHPVLPTIQGAPCVL